MESINYEKYYEKYYEKHHKKYYEKHHKKYHEKYCEYKQKYLQLKKQTGGKSNGLIFIGKFMIESGKLLVKDPGYEIIDGRAFSDKIITITNGVWNAYIKRDIDDNTRISELIIYYDNFKDNKLNNWKQITTVDVDTGQAGFFDYTHFRNDMDIDSSQNLARYVKIKDKGDKWYAMCCAITYDDKNKTFNSGVIPFGAVASSGYGDGLYDVFGIKLNNKLVGLKIVFI